MTQEEMMKDKDVIRILYQEMEHEANENHFASFERVKIFKLIQHGFGKLDLLTPNFKLKRFVARKAFKDDIEELYKLQPFKSIMKKKVTKLKSVEEK